MLKTKTPPDEEPKPGSDDARPELLLLAEQFTSTPRCARLARRLAVRRMGEWGWPPASATSSTVALVVGELAANAVHHGRAPGRDFQLCLSYEARTRVLRVEVSDASSDQPPASPQPPSTDEESGRGLLLVEALATRWGVVPRDPVGKTVWAELAAEAEEPQPPQPAG